MRKACEHTRIDLASDIEVRLHKLLLRQPSRIRPDPIGRHLSWLNELHAKKGTPEAASGL